jgi:cobalt-zinc-cadmium efflux system outer membrane protein
VVAAARRTFDLLANRVAEGAAAPLERDLALVELRRLEGERALESGRRAVALSNLNILLGRAPGSSLTLADSLEHLATVPVAGGDVPTPDRADVQAAAADLAVARAGTRLAQQDGKPEISLFGSYMRMDAGFPQSGVNMSGSLEPIHGIFHNVALGVKVSLPVFDRGKGNAAAATARETMASHVLDGRRLVAAGEVASAAERLTAARQALTSYDDETRALARRNVDVVRETYSLGRATLLDVLTEQRRYLDFEAAYIGALAEAFAATTDLQRAKGALK